MFEQRSIAQTATDEADPSVENVTNGSDDIAPAVVPAEPVATTPTATESDSSEVLATEAEDETTAATSDVEVETTATEPAVADKLPVSPNAEVAAPLETTDSPDAVNAIAPTDTSEISGVEVDTAATEPAVAGNASVSSKADAEAQLQTVDDSATTNTIVPTDEAFTVELEQALKDSEKTVKPKVRTLIRSQLETLVETPDVDPVQATGDRENLTISPTSEPEVPIEQPTRLVLRLRQRRVYLFKGAQKVASYPVAIGKRGWETPQGSFQVFQKIPHPVWQHPWTGKIVPPGPKNPLGKRWIGFATAGKNLIGFHGTINESLIGQAVSHGCVRMRNADVAELFEKIELGTKVVVKP
ncbi:L,D-transpeptidase family protein [filamentous cyanobacterium LEGE 11480]|uniref:L,D-transpeptidase family protein n=2 Tax=Romeriopsis TaxID=2992131 RepID=A0A928Z4C2_9CYAN|nr:L,D-transpeptidase family protein [Romeriopsis navalis LEGE 11480]